MTNTIFGQAMAAKALLHTPHGHKKPGKTIPTKFLKSLQLFKEYRALPIGFVKSSLLFESMALASS